MVTRENGNDACRLWLGGHLPLLYKTGLNLADRAVRIAVRNRRVPGSIGLDREANQYVGVKAEQLLAQNRGLLGRDLMLRDEHTQHFLFRLRERGAGRGHQQRMQIQRDAHELANARRSPRLINKSFSSLSRSVLASSRC